jgi:hypothetical protein
MLIFIMGVTHTKALVLDLTPPAASKRKSTPYRNISTADNTVSSPTAPWHRHRTGNARRQSAWLPCDCRSSRLLVSLASIPRLPTALALQVHHAEDGSILLSHVELTQ